MFDKIKIEFARFYNSLPSSFKVTIMNGSSTFLSGLSVLIIRDLTKYGETISNEYMSLALVFFILVIGAIINVIQQKIVEQGTKILAVRGDEKTVAKLEATIVEKQDMIDLGK